MSIKIINENFFDIAFMIAEKNNVDLLKELSKGYNLTKEELKTIMFTTTKSDTEYLDLCYHLKELCVSMVLGKLTTINNPKLKTLSCSFCELTELEICSNLEYLDCSYNFLNSLDLSYCTSLTELNCGFNLLKELPTINTETLSCENNKITDLIITKSMINVDCSFNHISELDLTGNKKLLTLNCRNNRIKELDISNTSLYKLICHNNPLERIILTEEQNVYIKIYKDDNVKIILK